MAAQEELQILLKAVGAKDTEAALKNISGLLRKTGEDAKSVGPGSKVASAALGELKAKGTDLAGSLGPAGSVLSALGPAGLAAAAGIGATAGASLLAASTLRDWTQSMLDTAGALTDQRDETDISLKALQEYSYIAAAAGTTQGELVSALQRASRVIAEGGEAAEKAAAKLGLPFEKLRALNPDQQLTAIKAALDGVSSSAEKAAILKDLGFRDPAILRVMAQDVAGLRKEFNDLGLGVQDDVLERFDAMGDELAKLGVATDQFKLSIVQMAFGNADAGQSIKDLTALVAEAGAAAREAAPLFSDLFTVITGADLTTQIERFRFLIAGARSLATFVKSGGKELSISFPSQPSAPQKPNALSDVGTKPGPGDAALQRAKAAAEALKALQSTVAEGAIGIAKSLAEMAIAGDRSLTELQASFARIDADTKSKLDTLSKSIQDAVSKGVSPASAKAAAVPLVAAIKEAAAAAKAAASDALSAKLFGPGVEAIQTQIKGIAEQWSILVGTVDPSAGQFAAAADSLGKLKAQLTAQEWAAVRAQVAGLGIDLDQLAKGIDTIRARAKPLAADAGGAITLIARNFKAEAQGLITETSNGLREQESLNKAILAELDAQLERGDLKKAQYEELKAQLVDVKGATVDWSSVLGDVRNAFEVLGISTDSFFGKVLGGFSAALAAAQRFKEAQKKGGLEGAVGQGLAGLQAGAAAFQSGSALGGAASGAAFGASVGGPLGGIIGGVAGGILGIFGGKARVRKELADLRKQLLDSVGGSMEELRKRASALGVDISAAFTTKNPKELKKIIDELNKAAEEQKKRWEGVQTAVAGLTQRVAGFTAELGRSGEATVRQEEEFRRLGAFAVATFGNYVRESGDVIGALRELGDSLGSLSDAQQKFGFEGSAAIDKLLSLRGVVSANMDVADSIQGLNQIIQGLGDSGRLTAEDFNLFGQDAVELFTQLTERGAGSNQALSLLSPTLQRLWEHQKRFGDITDEATLALLAEAETQGVVGESMKAVNEQILDVLLAIGDALGAKIPEGLRRMGDAAQREFGRFGNAADNASGNIPSVGDFGGGAGFGPPIGPGGQIGGDGFAVGGTVHAPLGGQQVTVHGTEHILRPEQLGAIVNAAVQRAVGVAAREFSGSRQAPVGDVVMMLDGEVLGRARRRDMESVRHVPRRGPFRGGVRR